MGMNEQTSIDHDRQQTDILGQLISKRDEKTGLSRIECRHAAMPTEEMTPERVASILLELEMSCVK
jgi:hypothetical protein